MTAFLAFSDESCSNQSGYFFYSGLVAPESDWNSYFSPAWQERVLDGPPTIPYLHTTEIKSICGREKFGITSFEADRCMDEAINIFSSTGSIFPITVCVDALLFNEITDSLRIREVDTRQFRAPYKFEPDFLCFLIYIFYALKETSSRYPDVEKIDFIVERNGRITSRFNSFYRDLPSLLPMFGYPELVNMMGKIILEGKTCIPLQAADLWNWYTFRARDRNLQSVDIYRLLRLTDKLGIKHNVEKSFLEELINSLMQHENHDMKLFLKEQSRFV
jgi:hypothetical protein